MAPHLGAPVVPDTAALRHQDGLGEGRQAFGSRVCQRKDILNTIVLRSPPRDRSPTKALSTRNGASSVCII